MLKKLPDQLMGKFSRIFFHYLFIPLPNTKEDILKNIGNQTTFLKISSLLFPTYILNIVLHRF